MQGFFWPINDSSFCLSEQRVLVPGGGLKHKDQQKEVDCLKKEQTQANPCNFYTQLYALENPQ